MRSAYAILFCYLTIVRVCAQETESAYSADSVEAIDLSAYTGEFEEVVGSAHQLIPPDEVETTRLYQSEDVSMRSFDEEIWREIVGSTDFSEAPSEKREGNKQEAETLSMPWAGPLVKIFSYVLIVGVVVWLLYLVLKNVAFDLRIRRAELHTDEIENGVENIEAIDIQILLDQARAEGNLRVAIRLYYLGLLKKLHELNVIVWKKDKTNQDYLSELFGRNFYYDDVRWLTRSYEAVWYGGHAIELDAFRTLSAKFESLYREINNPPAAQ